MTRQREWQRMQRRMGRCIICGEEAAPKVRRDVDGPKGQFCVAHKALKNEYMKAYLERRRRK